MRRMSVIGRMGLPGALITAFMIGGCVIGVVPASAAIPPDRGPAAAADQYGNEYVFWKNQQGYLTEAYWNAYTGRWNGPMVVTQMGILGSQPSVATSVALSDGGPGGHLYSTQYVAWEGTDHHLWYGYWGYNPGSWHGPYNLGMGTIGSQPSIAETGDLAPLGGDPVHIYWSGNTGGLWSAATATALDPHSFTGPNLETYGGKGFGTLGSSPSATHNQVVSQPAFRKEWVYWQGSSGGGLWHVQRDCEVQCAFLAPTQITNAGTLGSPPSAVAEYTGSADPDVFWKGTDAGLWQEYPAGPREVSGMGPLGSAPSVAWSKANPNDLYVFWKGTDGYLWEAYHQGDGSWTLFTYPRFGQIG